MSISKRQIFLILGLSMIIWPVLLSPIVYADGVSQIDSFIKSLVQDLAGLAGIVATGFFVFGGFNYITSSGNPHHLERAKRTILFAGIGLAITIAAYVLSGIVSSLATSAFGS